jgi:prolyl-tRNA synthetase
MGSYGIGVGRILAAAIELYGDADGICWPISIAPYEVVITAINVTDEKVIAIATDIYDKLRSAGVDVLFDDRDMQAGAKFKDADMIGMPIRVTVGRGITKGVVEIFRRKEKSKIEVPIEKAVEETLKLREELFAAIK